MRCLYHNIIIVMSNYLHTQIFELLRFPVPSVIINIDVIIIVCINVYCLCPPYPYTLYIYIFLKCNIVSYLSIWVVISECSALITNQILWEIINCSRLCIFWDIFDITVSNSTDRGIEQDDIRKCWSKSNVFLPTKGSTNPLDPARR